jgi:hypothetical protein
VRKELFTAKKDMNNKFHEIEIFKTENEFRAFSLGRRAYFLYHLVRNYNFKHLIRRLNIGYTQ